MIIKETLSKWTREDEIKHRFRKDSLISILGRHEIFWKGAVFLAELYPQLCVNFLKFPISPSCEQDISQDHLSSFALGPCSPTKTSQIHSISAVH